MLGLSIPTIYKKDSVEEKQYRSYYNEVELILSFMFMKNAQVKPSFELIEQDQVVSINVPCEKLLTMTECSGNTYSRIINSLNRFTLTSWIVVYNHLIKCTQIKKD